jgi:starch-binding outer membrane protein, SusD/RagB family
MIRKLYKYLVISLLGLIIYSCSDSWLDLQPVAAENSGSFYLTMGQAEQAVTAAYSTFSSLTTWDRDICFIGDVPSDDGEAGGDFENEVPGWEEFNRFTILTSNGTLSSLYGVLFRGIYFSNLALNRIPGVLETDPNADAAIINQRIAELKAIRAINYLYLLHIFGEVPLVDHILGASEYQLGRSTFADLFTFVEKDLREAIPVLPNKSDLSAEDIGRVSKGAAMGFLARAMLFESSYKRYYPGDARYSGLTEKWDSVLYYCEEIINSEEYSLVGTDGETYPTWRSPNTDGFRFMFTSNGDNCEESLFEVQYISDGLAYTNTRAGSLCQWTAARYYYQRPGNSQLTGYWGLDWPTQSLFETFETGDARLKTTIATEGDSIEIAGGIRYPISFESSGTGYYCRKWECSAAEFADVSSHAWHKSPMNFRLIRYADVVLMAAEAALITGDNPKALGYVNLIRTRARNCGTSNVPLDLTGQLSFEQLVNERRAELALEGRRFFDLVRWNIAVEKLNNYTTPGGFLVTYESPKNDYMPLPEREITLSGGALEQYPGW